MRILVTGASGFIGRRVVDQLARSGHDVHAIARTAQGSEAESVSWHRLDLFDSTEVAKVIATVRPAHLIHLAWEARPAIFWTAPENREWVIASEALLRAFAEAGGSSFVGAGSCAEISDTTLYAQSKNAFRALAERYCSDRGFRFAWGRIFFPYGAGEPREKFVSMLIETLRSGKAVELREPDRRLDFVHVDDVARALVEIDSSNERGVFDIGSGAALEIRELAQRVASVAAGSFRSASIQERPNLDAEPDLVADVSRLRSLGWEPRVSLAQGLSGFA